MTKNCPTLTYVTLLWYLALDNHQILLYHNIIMSGVWIQPIKKVLDSVGQSDYHDITQNTSKIKI